MSLRPARETFTSVTRPSTESCSRSTSFNSSSESTTLDNVAGVMRSRWASTLALEEALAQLAPMEREVLQQSLPALEQLAEILLSATSEI